MKFSKKLNSLAVVGVIAFSTNSYAGTSCSELMSMVGGYNGFAGAVSQASMDTQGLGLGFVGMWATLMDTDGTVCAVHSVDATGAANGGSDAGNASWLGSRVISAQKANTANAFSLDAFSIPTGAVYAAVLPGGSLYGLQHSNPVDITKTYKGSDNKFGTKSDKMKNTRPGGVNVFGGGFALYDDEVKVGAVGVSGDTSCRDAAIAYRLRAELMLDDTPDGQADVIELVDPTLPVTDAGALNNLFQQPYCLTTDDTDFPSSAGDAEGGLGVWTQLTIPDPV